MGQRRRLHHFHTRNDTQGSGAENDLAKIWMLRILLGSNNEFRSFYKPSEGYSDNGMAEFLGLPPIGYESPDIPPAKIRKQMEAILAKLEKRPADNSCIARNVAMLATHIPLSEVQQDILKLAVIKEVCEPLADCLSLTKMISESRFHAILGLALDAPLMLVREGLARDGMLLKTGLIKLELDRIRDHFSFEVMDDLKNALLAENSGDEDLMRHFLVPGRASSLDRHNFPHLAKDLDIMTRMLRAAMEKSTKGVNILLYGPPGTGKTELARLIAREVRASLFEVKTEDEDGDPTNEKGRLMGYRLSQHMLAGSKRAMILFDEVEDIFPSRSYSFFGLEIGSAKNKGWINKALEENPVPTIWISNQIGHLDPAVLRRFNFTLEVPVPPRSVRLEILRDRLKSTPVRESFLARLAEHERLSAGQISKAAEVAQLLDCENASKAETVIERVLDRSTRAMGLKPLAGKHSDSTHYNLSLLHIDAEPAALVEGLKRSGRGNLCFYGPPGTGKTAFARHIAEQLDKPLLCRRASDILSKWVGGTEQNIAAMFARARDEDAVLVLDEADSFLRDRRGAEHSWEVTQVNELLVQMENFEGVFICSTNLMDDLDQASLRRFALKVRFDFLKPDQAVRILRQECATPPTEGECIQVARLPNLTPGDFAAVKKRLAILGEPFAPEAMIRGLREELEAKHCLRESRIGFLAPQEEK